MSDVIGHDGNRQRERVKESLASIRKLQKRISGDRDTYPGSFDVRCIVKPGLFSMWIKDRNGTDDAMAHITLFQYRGESHSPSFRLSNKACKRALENLKAEFEEVWGNAKAPPS